MCVCEEGYVLDNGRCIEEENCGCITENGASIPNDYKFQDCQKSCHCSGGNITWFGYMTFQNIWYI